MIEAEEKRKNKAAKGKRREELEKRNTNLQPQFVGCKIGAFFTIKLGSDIFYFFYSGEGKGVRGARKGVGGVFLLLKIQEGGFSQKRGGGGGRGAGRVSAGNLGGGGAKYFFSGPQCPPSLLIDNLIVVVMLPIYIYTAI